MFFTGAAAAVKIILSFGSILDFKKLCASVFFSKLKFYLVTSIFSIDRLSNFLASDFPIKPPPNIIILPIFFIPAIFSLEQGSPYHRL